MGDQEQCTDIAKDNPMNGNIMQNGVMQMPVVVWNSSMQFHIKNINQDNLVITVYEKCLFTPDGKLKTISLFLKLKQFLYSLFIKQHKPSYLS